jgi:hypothetical protein
MPCSSGKSFLMCPVSIFVFCKVHSSFRFLQVVTNCEVPPASVAAPPSPVDNNVLSGSDGALVGWAFVMSVFMLMCVAVFLGKRSRSRRDERKAEKEQTNPEWNELSAYQVHTCRSSLCSTVECKAVPVVQYSTVLPAFRTDSAGLSSASVPHSCAPCALSLQQLSVPLFRPQLSHSCLSLLDSLRVSHTPVPQGTTPVVARRSTDLSFTELPEDSFDTELLTVDTVQSGSQAAHVGTSGGTALLFGAEGALGSVTALASSYYSLS